MTFTALGTAIATPKRRPDDPGARLAVTLVDPAGPAHQAPA